MVRPTDPIHSARGGPAPCAKRARASVPDIFDEVAEDLRAERTRAFLMRYAGALAGAAVFVLLAIGGWKAWQWHRHQQDVAAASHYVALTSQIGQQEAGLTKSGAIGDAKRLVDFAGTAPAGYANLARLRAAALYAQAGDLKTASQLWAAVASPGSGATPPVHDLALLLLAQHEMGVKPDADVRGRLATLNKPGNPWQPLAQLDLALLDIKAGQTKSAHGLLEEVSADPASPPNLRNLAQGLIAKLNG